MPDPCVRRIEMWLAAAEPYLTAVAMVDRLLAYTPGGFGDRQLRTLQSFVKSWRGKTAKLLIVRRLVGSGRFEGLEAAQVLARLYAAPAAARNGMLERADR